VGHGSSSKKIIVAILADAPRRVTAARRALRLSEARNLATALKVTRDTGSRSTTRATPPPLPTGRAVTLRVGLGATAMPGPDRVGIVGVLGVQIPIIEWV
jgi:hypothetical protein